MSFCACFAVGILLVQLYRSSMDAQVARAEAVVAHACDQIEEQAGTSPDLTADVTLALLHEPGVEGGIWHHTTGPLAYAFPTYDGTGPKTDLPAAERDQIAAINQRAQSTRQPVSQRVVLRAQTLLLHACQLRATPDQTAWTMTRVQAAPGFSSLRLGLGVLFALMILMSAWLGRMLLVWGRHLRGIEAALAGAGPAGMPAVPRTGERELDRIIDALNIAGLRLADARLESDRMAARMARTERLAGLGRVAAGIAHEIRNPIAAARLQGENALAGDDARRRLAITDMLTQIERLDTLVNELLAMTQRVDPVPVPVDLSAFLIAQAAHHTAAAAARAIEIITECPAATASLDPAMIGRVLDNLLSNAIRHTPAQGQVRLAATIAPGRLAITVADTGPGIAPDMTETLFEPFVTGRAEGTGLGLAIARELADAHGATLTHRRAENGQTGAVFTLELPQDQNWPPS